MSSLPEPRAGDIAAGPREISTAFVDYSHGGAPMEGYLAEPAGGGSKAILICHAWMGVGENVMTRAEMVARLGYTAFAVDLYGKGVRPTEFEAMRAEAEKYYSDLGLLRARVAAGFDWLVARGFAAEDIVVIGYCFGASAAIEFDRTGQAHAGTVAFHPRLIAHDPSDAHRIAAPLLIEIGAADDVIPDRDLTAFMDELRAVPELDWRIVVHAGAPHAFTVAGPMYRESADRRSWRDFVDFLADFAPVP